MLIRPLLAGALVLALAQLHAAETTAPAAAPAATPAAKKPSAPAVEPTLANVPYGTHPKQVLDFYKAESSKPTALVFYIHGGGWTAGSKARAPLGSFLKNGISVVSVEYRFIQEAMAGGAKPPVSWPLHDAARALQFVRSKAQEWNIDKKRIGATGGSAGACSSLWLAFHDDMADPKSSDPIARESTRLLCAAVDVAQTSLDPKQLKEWTPNSRYGGHAFGFMVDVPTRDRQFDQFLAHRDELLPLIKEYSPYELVTSDDPPVYLIYRDAPALGQPAKDPTHTVNYGVKLQEKAKSVGVDCELVYPGAPDVKHASIEAYLLDKLAASKQ
jgi:acetyl esterase/lipase